MKKGRGAVYIIAVVLTILFIIGAVILLVLLALHKINWLYFILSLISGGIELILVWALNNALERIAVLESLLVEKKVVKESEITETAENEFNEEQAENITFCKHCGFQLFPEDEVCPNCNKKVDANDETEK